MKKIFVVDMHSGSYQRSNYGHEIFNLRRNEIDGRYYGYVPPLDKLDIKKLGASSDEKFVDDILVIFVKAISKGNTNRIIIGYYPSARVYATKRDGTDKNRKFIDKDGSMKVASYTIESDSCIIVDKDNSFIIDLIKYNNRYMFRNQKIYPSLEKYTNDHNNYSELYKEILNWFNGYEEMLKENPKLRNIQLEFKEAKIGQEDLIDNDEDIQREAQYINSATYEQIKDAPTKEILIKESSSGKIIVRDPSLTKTAIVNANYQCEIDANHKTFINASGVPYMEGYHLIPCTVDNSNFIWERFERNVDCLENIVSLCPNCHRAIHFGNAETKEKMLVKLYSKKKTQLEKVGIRISFSHLLNFYKIKY